MSNWKAYDLRDLIELDLDRVPIDASEQYEMVGVYSFGRGLFQKENVQGSSTSYKNFYRLHPHHIIMSQLFGWEGALALSSEEFSGKYVSTQFPTFRLSSDKIDRSFLGWWLKRSEFWEELKGRAKVMGDRRRTLNPEALLVSKIVLPSIEEQRQIVEKIETIAAKVEEAKQLRTEIKADMEALLISMAHRADLNDKEKEKQSWKKTRLEEVLTLKSDPEKVEPGKEYPNFGIYSYARGLFKKPPIDGNLSKATKLYRVKTGQFIYSKLFAFEGAYGVVAQEYDQFFVSNEYPMFECDLEQILPEFLLAYIKSPFVWKTFSANTVGIGSRRKRINPSILLNHTIWLPPIEWQKKIKHIAEKLQTLQDDYSQSDAELDALLPSILDKAFKGELIKSVSSTSVSASKKTEISIPKDTAVICILIDELQKRDRSTDEFFLQKHAYAGKHCFDIPVGASFEAKAAGPWSKELTYETMAEGVERGWFKWEAGKYPNLIPGQFFSAALERAKNSLGEDNTDRVVKVVSELNRFQAPGLGRWATILKIVVDLRKDNQKITRDAIQRIMDLWPGKRNKKDFSKSNVDDAITKMVSRGWIELDS